MMFIFDKKLVSCLFVLFVVCLSIGAVSATNIHGDDCRFTFSGSDVYTHVPSDLSSGSHWEIAKCDGFELVSHNFYPSNSKEIGSSEVFHLKELLLIFHLYSLQMVFH